MIRAGDVIENPVTGERIVFLETSAETNGEAVVFGVFGKPSGFVAKPHVHPSQTENFEILEGSLVFKSTVGSCRQDRATASSSRRARSTGFGTRATRRRASGTRSAQRSRSSR